MTSKHGTSHHEISKDKAALGVAVKPEAKPRAAPAAKPGRHSSGHSTSDHQKHGKHA